MYKYVILTSLLQIYLGVPSIVEHLDPLLYGCPIPHCFAGEEHIFQMIQYCWFLERVMVLHWVFALTKSPYNGIESIINLVITYQNKEALQTK